MKKSKLLMLLGSLLLLGVFTFPLWRITLEAPQYPEPIGMDIWINSIKDTNPHDIKNINLLNHYIGMAEVPVDMTEFIVFPAVVIGMILLGLAAAWKGRTKGYLAWFVLMALLGTAGMVDFYLWEKEYGNNLDEKAAIKFVDENDEPMVYQPPLIGTKMILNFTAHSYPRTGALFLLLGMGAVLGAYVVGRIENAAEKKGTAIG